MFILISEKKEQPVRLNVIMVRESADRADIVIADVIQLRLVERFKAIALEEIPLECVFGNNPPPPFFLPFSRCNQVRLKFKYLNDVGKHNRKIRKFIRKRGRR
jgi:hypothetical protein